MNEDLTKNTPKETLFIPSNPWIANRKDTKPYILEYWDNTKLSQSHYIATYIISYGPYKNNIFAIENFAYTFHWQFLHLIISGSPAEFNQDILMSKYNKFLLDRCLDTMF